MTTTATQRFFTATIISAFGEHGAYALPRRFATAKDARAAIRKTGRLGYVGSSDGIIPAGRDA